MECLRPYERMRIEFADETIPLDEQVMEQPEQPMGYETEMIEQIEMQMEQVQVETQIRELRPQITRVPTMRA
jgi:hypothetical protein